MPAATILKLVHIEVYYFLYNYIVVSTYTLKHVHILIRFPFTGAGGVCLPINIAVKQTISMSGLSDFNLRGSIIQTVFADIHDPNCLHKPLQILYV